MNNSLVSNKIEDIHVATLIDGQQSFSLTIESCLKKMHRLQLNISDVEDRMQDADDQSRVRNRYG